MVHCQFYTCLFPLVSKNIFQIIYTNKATTANIQQQQQKKQLQGEITFLCHCFYGLRVRICSCYEAVISTFCLLQVRFNNKCKIIKIIWISFLWSKWNFQIESYYIIYIILLYQQMSKADLTTIKENGKNWNKRGKIIIKRVNS